MIIVKCRRCGKEFKSIPSRIRIGHGKYCSKKCKTIDSRGKPTWSKGKRLHYQVWNKGKKMSQIAGRNHYRWKGDNASYVAKHSWLVRKYGRPNKCDDCGKHSVIGERNNITWANVSGNYIRIRSDWKRLCHKCHSKFDERGLRDFKNRKPKAKSGYWGVYFDNSNKNLINRWYVKIRVNGKDINKAYFKTKEEAAEVYNKLAKKYHGEFAKCNKLD